jgi:ubiquinone/menaquinone biosynthesis C-methylase UbiE
MSFAVSAEAYDRFMGRFSAPLAEALVAEAGIVGGMRVLDVGSGPGALSRALVDVVGPDLVAAVDPQPAFVEALGQRLPGVTATVGEAESLPHEDATFDACLANLVVHFMTDPVAGLREMARVTRPGGTVAATVWQHGTPTTPLTPFWRAVRCFDPDALVESERPGTTQGSLVRLMDEAGVSAAAESTLTVRGTFEDFDDYWGPFGLGVGPAGEYLAAQPPDRRHEIREAARDLVGPVPFTITGTAWCALGTA